MSTARCPACGAEYQVGERFCGTCGDYLEWSATEEPTPVHRATGSVGTGGAVPLRPNPPAGRASNLADHLQGRPVTPGDRVDRTPVTGAGGDAPVPPGSSARTSGPAAAASAPAGVPIVRTVLPATDQPARGRPVAAPVHRIPTSVRDLGPARLTPRPPSRRDAASPATDARVEPVLPARARSPVHATPARRTAAVTAVEGGCVVCGRLPVAGRRFCDCGARLGAVERTTPVGRPPAAPPRPTSRAAFRRAARTVGGRRRVRFDRPVSGRTTATRVLGVALVAVVLGALTQAPGAWLWREGGKLVLGPLVAVPVTSAVTDPVPAPPAQDTAPWAVDGQETRAWSAPWQADPAAALPDECGASPAPALVVEFDGPVRLDAVRVYAGLTRDSSAWSTQHVPRVVDLQLSNGDCERLTLDGTEPVHEVPLEVDGVTTARLTVVDVTAPVTGDGGTVSIAELTFLRR